jgi:hypothetical protein
LFDTGTNFPAVSLNSLLASAMTKMRQRWNESADPTHPQSQVASRTASACTKMPRKIKYSSMQVVIYYYREQIADVSSMNRSSFQTRRFSFCFK